MDELNLLADRSSPFTPMAEGGGCYGCLTLCNAIIFCVVHARGPVDPWPYSQIGGVAWRNRYRARETLLIIDCVYMYYVLCNPFV